jgi:hypothetical protein
MIDWEESISRVGSVADAESIKGRVYILLDIGALAFCSLRIILSVIQGDISGPSCMRPL